MALGDGGQITQRKSNEDSYNSRLTVFSPDGNKYLKFKFWAGKISISINVGENNNDGFKYVETAAVYLTPSKAKILANELSIFKDDVKHLPIGVITGNGDPNTCITFMRDKDSNIIIDIRKIDGQGATLSGDTFKMQKDYHFAVNYKNFDKLDFEKKFYNDIELESIIDILNSFNIAANGATAYSVIDMSRFNYSRIRSNTEAIMDKLGIQRASSRGGSGQSFFNGGSRPQGSMGHSDHVEDIDDLL